MKILYVTTIGGTMSFFTSLIRDLLNCGHIVDIAANEEGSKAADYYREWGCRIYPLSCSRSPLKIDNLKAVKQIKRIAEDGQYDVIHCHTPIASMCTRLACRAVRKTGTRVIYTAHGFHFYKGAPLKNWLIYYLVEWICSYWTDILVTINREDYIRAQKHMHAKRVEYIPGVGIDAECFSSYPMSRKERKELRSSMGVEDDDTLLLSVGELNENKNHTTVIRAIAQLQNSHVHYAIAGLGDLRDSLLNLSEELKVEKQIHLLGFRADMPALYKAADIYIHPSFREGLPVSLMEAMASGLPCIASNIRGNRDLLADRWLVEPSDVNGFTRKMEEFMDRDFCRTVGLENKNRVNKFDYLKINRQISALYNEQRL